MSRSLTLAFVTAAAIVHYMRFKKRAELRKQQYEEILLHKALNPQKILRGTKQRVADTTQYVSASECFGLLFNFYQIWTVNGKLRKLRVTPQADLPVPKFENTLPEFEKAKRERKRKSSLEIRNDIPDKKGNNDPSPSDSQLRLPPQSPVELEKIEAISEPWSPIPPTPKTKTPLTPRVLNESKRQLSTVRKQLFSANNENNKNVMNVSIPLKRLDKDVLTKIRFKKLFNE